MGKRVGMIDALQERQIIEGISYSVHLLNGKSLADDLDAASLGTPFGNHIYMGHILKCRDFLSIQRIDLRRGLRGGFFIRCRYGNAVYMGIPEFIDGINVCLQIICFEESVDRIICLKNSTHGWCIAVVNALYGLQGQTFAEKDIFLSVNDQSSARQNIKIRTHPGTDDIAHTDKRSSGTDSEQAASLLKIYDPENIRRTHGFLISHKIQGIVEITGHGPSL